ncbi:MAG: ATP-binding cassette domain-containing protein [Pirellulaceae bacterium]
MPLLTVRNVSIRFRGPPLLDGVDCRIEPGQRIGLLGRNGAGKTTFLRLLAGEISPDHGEIVRAPGVKVSLLAQEVPLHLSGKVAEVVATGVQAEAHRDDAEWRIEHQVDQILSRMELDGDAAFERLSSGMKRRVLLARALADQPDLLLLDEPTNHLDLDAIGWLEDFLGRWNAAFMFITHDRMFLRRMATRILEVERGRLFDWSCDYATFLERKEAALAAEEKQDALFDKRLAEEEVWIRTGIKARRTRNEGRVRALEAMRRVRQERRERVGTSNLRIVEGERSGQLVAQAEGISFAYGAQPVFRNFSTTILRGDKVGIIGRNGAGKTTLLRVLLGQLPPQEGSVRLGTNLRVAYFDQLRQQLDDDLSVEANVGEGSSTIFLGDKPQHVIGYLQEFLFTPERARTPVSMLSGGERNRVLLAKLFAKPANVVVLDEPTNDLDAETLEMLEERLLNYGGTLLVVSHDREFLNNVVTSTIAFEERGVREYVGGYDDWLRQRAAQQPPPLADRASPSRSAASGAAKSTRSAEGPRRLSFKEKQELDALPERIQQIEADIAALHQSMTQPDYYKRAGEVLAAEQAQLKRWESELQTAYHRWEELEARSEL